MENNSLDPQKELEVWIKNHYSYSGDRIHTWCTKEISILNWSGPRRTLFVVIAFWVFITGIPTYFVYTNEILPQKIIMDGEINIAVVGFTEIEGNAIGKEEEKLISTVFFNRLNSKFEEFSRENNVVVQILGPEKAKAFSGTNPADREDEAFELANDINADIIIHGTIKAADGKINLKPEFFVHIRNFYEIEEIRGDYFLGKEVVIPFQNGEVGSQLSANRELSNRADLLALLTKGLSLYLISAYEDSYEVFKLAENDKFWQTEDGKEIIYVFQGNAAGKSMLLDQSEEAYLECLELKPDYSRCLIGLGNLYFLNFFQKGMHTEYLEKSLEAFDLALVSEDQPPTADIPIKSAFGKGQAYLIYWYRGETTRENVENYFYFVINQYENQGNERIKEYAAESYSRLGLIEKQEGNFEQSMTYFQEAINLSDDPSREAIYLEQLADLQMEVGKEEEARLNYLNSIEENKSAISLKWQNKLKAQHWETVSGIYIKLENDAEAITALENAQSYLSSSDPQWELLELEKIELMGE